MRLFPERLITGIAGGAVTVILEVDVLVPCALLAVRVTV